MIFFLLSRQVIIYGAGGENVQVVKRYLHVYTSKFACILALKRYFPQLENVGLFQGNNETNCNSYPLKWSKKKNIQDLLKKIFTSFQRVYSTIGKCRLISGKQ